MTSSSCVQPWEDLAIFLPTDDERLSCCPRDGRHRICDHREERALANNIDREALEVLRLLLRQTERGRNLDASLVERAKALFENYDRVMREVRATVGGAGGFTTAYLRSAGAVGSIKAPRVLQLCAFPARPCFVRPGRFGSTSSGSTQHVRLSPWLERLERKGASPSTCIRRNSL